jgi:hypothetical protein
MQTIEEAALQAADPLAVKTMAQRAEHLADVATYIEENYPAARFLAIETECYGGDRIHLGTGGEEIVRWLGPVKMTAACDAIKVETQFRGVAVFCLVDSFTP